MKFLPAVALSLLVLGCPAVFAQNAPLEFTLQGGYANPMGPTAEQLGGGASLDAAAQYNATPRFSFGLEAGYIFNLAIKGTGGSGQPLPDNYASVFHLTPEFRYGLPSDWHGYNVRPYVVAGGGFYWTHFSGGTYDNAGLTQTVEDTENANGGLNAGAGLDVTLRENITVGLDLRYHAVLYRNVNNLQFLIPSLRVSVLM